jgi:hypothetical protein
MKLALLTSKMTSQACGACGVKPYGSSRLLWYGNHNLHHNPTEGKANQQWLWSLRKGRPCFTKNYF